MRGALFLFSSFFYSSFSYSSFSFFFLLFFFFPCFLFYLAFSMLGLALGPPVHFFFTRSLNYDKIAQDFRERSNKGERGIADMAMDMDRKEALTRCFFDTDMWCRSTERLRRAVKNTRRGSTIYRTGEMVYIPDGSATREGKVTITKETPVEAAMRLGKSERGRRLALVNAGSALTPGSGVRRGLVGTEEELCRCSTLYPDLCADEYMRSYYQGNQNNKTFMNSDSCIYSPDVFIVKDETKSLERLSEHLWQKVDVITCSAPNLRAIEERKLDRPSDEELLKVHAYRAMKVMAVAVAHGCSNLVLCAPGCAGYRNDPVLVAKAFHQALEELGSYFHQIVFAMGGNGRSEENYEAFQSILG